MNIFFCSFTSKEFPLPTEEILKRLPNHQRQAKGPYTLLGRAYLRYLLCDTLSVSNKKLEIKYTEKGKPYISFPLYFSLTHTAGAFAVALRNTPVGLDIEHRDRKISNKIIARYGLNPDSPIVDWICIEAEGKYTGDGLRVVRNPSERTFSIYEQDPYLLALCTSEQTDATVLSVKSEDVLSSVLSLDILEENNQ